jgi:hypothetical protein
VLIAVIYNNSRIDVVDVARLDDLIRRNSVISFKRESGWVRTGFDAVRESQKPFAGSEKRGFFPQAPAPTVMTSGGC